MTAPTWLVDLLADNACDNCDGRKCMGCIFREYDHVCADNCPDCCDPESRFMQRMRRAAEVIAAELRARLESARAERCTCPWVDPKFWTTHYGAVEPGSTQEYDPTCPLHGALRDRAERAEAERDEAQMERSDALAEVERLRDRWRDDVTGQDLVEGNAQLGDEVIRLRAKVARVEKLAEEWKRLPGGVVIDAQAEVTDPFTAALADEGGDDE